jgi:PAS domain S-box-containing protein
VREASTGAEALRLASEQPDLIILDINLPDLNGRDVCQRLKANPETASIPVMHLSASFVDSEHRAEGLESGADGYLTYPVESRELVANVEALLRMRRAEREANTQRELLRITLNSIGDAVVATDVNGHITFLNGVAQALTGWAGDDATGQPLGRVVQIVQEGARKPEDPVTRVLRDEKVVGVANHAVLIARDGTEHLIEDSVAPIRDQGGHIVGVILVFRDVSERRRSEVIIQDAREYAESIVDTVREPLLVLDRDLRVRSASRAFYETFQVTPETTEGRLIYELGNGQWQIPKLRELLDETLNRNTTFQDLEVEHTFPTIGHRVMLLNARRIRREAGASELILLAIEDISQRRRAERGLKESEERFRLMVEAVRDYAIILLDSAGRVITWNHGAERILGYQEAEIIGKNASVFFTAEDRQAGRPEEELQEAIRSGRAGDDSWLVRKDGSRFFASGATTALRDDGSGLRGFVKILRDLTERKGLEDALRERAELLAEADKRKDEFLATLAHELRNPLAPIRNALHLEQLADPAAKTDVQEARKLMERQLEQLVRLVDDLLDVSRITRGKIRLNVEPIDLPSVLARAIEGSRPFIDVRRHNLTVNLPEEQVPLVADPLRLAQVFMNLLTNAAKYTPDGGEIQLSFATTRPIVGKPGEAVVRVRDSGIGIAPEMLPTVFDLFTQETRGLDRSEGGLGIGLTLVRRLTEMHGGSVVAFSAGLGHGSEFVVRLPLADQASLALIRTESPPRQPPRSVARRILVVDDNRDSAESLSMLLRLMGNDVRTAYEGRLALEIAAVYQPDIVLLDIGLPGLDGFEVCRRLRDDASSGCNMIVAMTGYGREEDRRRSLEAGFHAHLVKPVELKALQGLLSSSLSRR